MRTFLYKLASVLVRLWRKKQIDPGAWAPPSSASCIKTTPPPSPINMPLLAVGDLPGPYPLEDHAAIELVRLWGLSPFNFALGRKLADRLYVIGMEDLARRLNDGLAVADPDGVAGDVLTTSPQYREFQGVWAHRLASLFAVSVPVPCDRCGRL